MCWLQSKSDLLTLDVFVELSLVTRKSLKISPMGSYFYATEGFPTEYKLRTDFVVLGQFREHDFLCFL